MKNNNHSQVLQRSNFMGGESGFGVKSPCLTPFIRKA